MFRPMLALVATTFVLTFTTPLPAVAAPGDPFGGDDAGCFPPDDNALKCENAVAAAAAKAFQCLMHCHIARASGKLADEAAEEACERTDPKKSCAAKFEQKTGPGTKIAKLCPPAYDATYRAGIFAGTETVVDQGNQNVYPCPAPPCFDTAPQCNGTCPVGQTCTAQCTIFNCIDGTTPCDCPTGESSCSSSICVGQPGGVSLCSCSTTCACE